MKFEEYKQIIKYTFLDLFTPLNIPIRIAIPNPSVINIRLKTIAINVPPPLYPYGYYTFVFI